MTGRIALVTKDNEIIRSCTYTSPTERNDLISGWRKQYGHRFNSCFLQISHNKFFGAIDSNGRNVRSDSPRKINFPSLDLERATGKYSNKSSFNN